MEHRWGQRIAVVIPVQLASMALSLRNAMLTNLSVTGALVAGDFRPRLFARVQIVFKSPLGLEGVDHIIPGHVVGNCEHGTGIEWCESSSPLIVGLLRAMTPGVNVRIARGPVTLPVARSLDGPIYPPAANALSR